MLDLCRWEVELSAVSRPIFELLFECLAPIQNTVIHPFLWPVSLFWTVIKKCISVVYCMANIFCANNITWAHSDRAPTTLTRTSSGWSCTRIRNKFKSFFWKTTHFSENFQKKIILKNIFFKKAGPVVIPPVVPLFLALEISSHFYD